jgi:hypothetical protein
MIVCVVDDHIHNTDTLVSQCLLHYRLHLGRARYSQPLGTECFGVLDKVHATQINAL